MLAAMDIVPVSETLPETYRHVLGRVADLEVAGYRREADLVRREAIAAYSRRWNQRAAARLEHLTERADRVLDGRDRARASYRSHRSAIAIWLDVASARARGHLAARFGRRRAEDASEMTLEPPTV